MGLYERLLRLEEPRIPVHAWSAVLGEYRRGEVTAQQVSNLFNLDSTAAADAVVLVARMDDLVNPITPAELHDVLLIADTKNIPAYKTVATLKARLGV